MTGIGAAFLAPERLGERGLTPSSLTYAPTGEQVASEARLRELRRADPGGLVIIKLLDEDDPADRRLLMRSLTFPGADRGQRRHAADLDRARARPAGLAAARHRDHAPADGRDVLPGAAPAHPRRRAARAWPRRWASAACCPARLLQDRVPALRGKGRLQPGADADIVVFDPATVSDRASYADSTRPSAGIRHVLVNGTFVVRDADTSCPAPSPAARSAPPRAERD